MKILFYSFFPGGGIGRYTDCLLSELDGHDDVDVELVCGPDFWHLDSASYQTCPRLMPIGAANALIRRTRFLTAQVVNPYRLIKRGREVRPDIIHFSNINHLTYAFWKKRFHGLNAKMVATAHDVRRLRSIISGRWETRSLKQFYQDCAAIFVHSSAQKNELLNFANVAEKRVHLVPHGVYRYPVATKDKACLLRQYNINSQRTVCLFFGYIRDDKRLELLLNAVRRSETPPFLIVAGQPGSRGHATERHYRDHIANCEMQNDTLFLSRFIPEDEVGNLFSVADFVALPYAQDFSSQSGVLHVASHFRCPVLTTPTPTVAETVSKYELGTVCEGFGIDEVAAGIERQCRSRKTDYASAFQRYIEQCSWQRNSQITIEVYRKLTGVDNTSNCV